MKHIIVIFAAVIGVNSAFASGDQNQAQAIENDPAMLQRQIQNQHFPSPYGEYPFARQEPRPVQTPDYTPSYIRTPSGYVEVCQRPGQEIAVLDARMVVRGYRTCR